MSNPFVDLAETHVRQMARLREALEAFDVEKRRADSAEQERDSAFMRIDDLANEIQTARNEVASLKEQLERANHALSLNNRTQSPARA